MVIDLARFGIVGLGATAAHYISALIASRFIDIFIANIIGFAFGFGISYVGHRLYTFRSAARHRSAVPRFLITSLSGLAASTVVLFIATSLALPVWLALVFSIGVIPIVTFFLLRSWVFKQRSGVGVTSRTPG
ncbi:MAG: GtrA family protein [Hyphomicrobiales bacterium]|nr:GtrA family protein [Hyphomicrobiales bacterium]